MFVSYKSEVDRHTYGGGTDGDSEVIWVEADDALHRDDAPFSFYGLY